MIDKKTLEEIVYKAPLVLLSIRDREIVDMANNYLPYSTGFEIECQKKSTYDESTFLNIPNFINDSYRTNNEQRYRIPNGVNGLICLYNICYHLGNNSLLNMGSGIHYHIDCTDTNDMALRNVVSSDAQFGPNILKELDTWNYGGTYNKRGISLLGAGNWIRYNDLNTLEFRIGNMSFDYEVLVKQIIHANDIVRRWKNKIPNWNDEITYREINYKSQIAYQKTIDIDKSSYEYKIQALLEKLNISEAIPNTLPIDDIKQTTKSRVHKLY